MNQADRSEHRLFRVTGPPGTGKTTFLAANVKAAAKRYGNDKVLVTSMTRAAAAEIAGRDLVIDKDHVGTLHSFCHQALDRPPLAETKDGITAWNAWASKKSGAPRLMMTVPQSRGSGSDRGEVDELLFAKNGEAGDGQFEQINLYRARMIEESLWPLGLRYFSRLWKEWKAESGMTDFTDWLEMCLEQVPEAPGKPKVIAADECLSGDTLISFADGRRLPIKEVVLSHISGDVLSYSALTNRLEAKPIVGWRTSLRKGRRLIRIGECVATDDHRAVTLEYGYLDFKSCIDLRCVHVLQLRHENLSRDERLDSNRKIGRRWFASWRRLDLAQLRAERERESQVRPGGSAGKLSSMEIRASFQMDKISSERAVPNRIWRDYLRICNTQPSSLYRDKEEVLSGRLEDQAHYRSDSFGSRCFGSCGMVYGRWKRRPEHCGNFYLQLHFGGLGESFRFLFGTGNCLPPKLPSYEEWLRSPLFGQGSGEFFRDDPAVRPSDLQVQNGPSREGSSTNARQGRAWEASFRDDRISVPNLPSAFQGFEIPNPLQVKRVPQGSGAPPIAELPSSKPSEIPSTFFRDLYYLRPLFRALSPTRRQPENLQSEMSGILCWESQEDKRHESCETSDEVVYCLDVEDNHNFFAGGILVHNCQDNSRLEMALLNKWGNAAEVLTVVGDPRQALYQWRGANPEVFYERDIPPENERLLEQSYRVPRAVHAVAERWIKQSTSDSKHPQVYKPRDADGVVKRVGATLDDPRYAISLVEKLVGQGKTVMVLATCSYMLDKTKYALREAGLPFQNSWRRRRADWNPLYSANGITSSERLLAFLRPYSEAWGEEAREWTVGDVKHWMGALKTADLWGARGAKTLLATLDDEARITEATIRTIFSQKVVDMTEMEFGPALRWYEDHLLEGKKKGGEFPIQIARKRGPAELLSEPLCTIGTCHSTKGAQAEWVLLWPDLSREAVKGWIRQGPLHDAIVRTLYVGMTRASEGLILGAPSSLDAVDWRYVIP